MEVSEVIQKIRTAPRGEDVMLTADETLTLKNGLPAMFDLPDNWPFDENIGYAFGHKVFMREGAD